MFVVKRSGVGVVVMWSLRRGELVDESNPCLYNTVSLSLTRFDHVVNHLTHVLLLATNKLIPSSNE